MQEIETKVLEVNIEEVKVKLKELGAKETQDTRLVVDWYCPKGIAMTKHPWYLRVRTTTDGKSEVSWKSLPKIMGNTRHSDEININVSDAVMAGKLFENIVH